VVSDPLEYRYSVSTSSDTTVRFNSNSLSKILFDTIMYNRAISAIGTLVLFVGGGTHTSLVANESNVFSASSNNFHMQIVT
jgi:hypothetical protein